MRLRNEFCIKKVQSKRAMRKTHYISLKWVSKTSKCYDRQNLQGNRISQKIHSLLLRRHIGTF